MKNRLLNKLYKVGITFILSISLSPDSSAQHFILGNDKTRIEAGLNFGPTFFLGDLGGGPGYGTKFLKDLNLEVTKMMKGAFVSFYPNEWIGLRVAGQYTYLEGRDNLIKTDGENEMYRKERNLDFKTDVWELYTALEYFPLQFIKRNDDDYNPRLKPYVLLGVGVYHFNPKGSLVDANGNTQWYDLQPLHTEGEGFSEYPDRKNYSLTQFNIPWGGGLKYELTERTNLSFELLYRKTFTDYVDDVSTTYIDPNLFSKYLSPENAAIARKISDKVYGVSNGLSRTEPGYQRGNPKNKDAYFSFVLKFGIKFGGGGSNGYGDGSGGGGRALSHMRCPARF